MRFNIKHLISLSTRVLTVVTLLIVVQSCKKESAEIDWVDLRYRVDDAYIVDASQPEPFTFIVKSTDKWEIIGTQDWYTISPKEGEAGESYTVTVTCAENTGLDDRTDTLYIKSEYWVGKKFVVTQLGTAYLNIDGVDIIPQEGGTQAFDILSNQRWTAEVTEGQVWLSIQSGTAGELDGQVVIKASPNKGEQRTGKVIIYDRHNNIAQEVSYTQDGVLLNAQSPANGKWFAVYEASQQLVIPVESNAEWVVSKENEVDDGWYTFEHTQFNGSGNLVVNVSEHQGSSVRTGTIVLTTKAAEGATPLSKTVRFKQANPQRPQAYNVNRVITENYLGPGSLVPGKYNFHFEPLGEAQLNLFFAWTGSTPFAELRYHILNKKTALSTTPWCSDVFPANANTTHNVNTNQANVLTLDIREVADRVDPTKSWIYTEWLLNGRVVAKATSDGISDANGTSDTWKVPFSETKIGANFTIRATGGSATLSKWEFVAPLDWGE